VQQTASDIISMIRADLIPAFIAALLCAMGAGTLLLGELGARNARRAYRYSGLFALMYGTRLLLDTTSVAVLSGHPPLLDSVRSSLEYLVPIPAALLFQTFSGGRWRFIHWITIGALVACAAVAIPYEVLTSSPYAMKGVIDVLVVALLAVFTLDVLTPGAASGDWRLVRVGALVFTAFVMNEHFHVIRDPWGLSREPTGFLFLMLTIVITTVQIGTRAQRRLVSVDSELATARAIQMAALPRANPNLTALDIATVYTPASDVAGDFYDFLELENGGLRVFIADVSGHGVPAALVASMLKIALATQRENATSPARVLASLNTLFCGRLERQFITASCVHIDPSASTIVVASAGHPPPLLRDGTLGTAEELIAAGVVLGRFRSAQYEEVSRSFAPGDALVLYTDGVSETANRSGEIWGDERLLATVAAQGAESSERLAAAIVRDVAEWRGVAGPPDDDVTLVVVRSVGAPG
jgi:sigma-B regulation protein RsbU (phosphoserine phosphatase)